MTRPEPARPLLLLLAHGVGARELPPLQGSARLGQIEVPVSMPPSPAHTLLRAFDATAALRNMGIEVDRSCLTLRPRGRTDETAIEILTRRATGPARVTVFEATGVLTQAIVGGANAALAAAARLALQLERLATNLRAFDLPEVWFVGLGSACAVHTSFDFDAAWRPRVTAPLANELTLRCTPGVATIFGKNQRALDIATHLLAQTPFTRHGRLLPSASGRLRFAALGGVAFTDRRVLARAPREDEARALAVLPRAPRTTENELDLAGLLARFWMRAVELHAPNVTHEPQTAPATARHSALLPIDEALWSGPERDAPANALKL
ncbi:MAG: hypothetical protein ABIP94_20335 [Planctomycetota bacterium]